MSISSDEKHFQLILPEETTDISLPNSLEDDMATNIDVSLAALSDKNRKEYEATLAMWSIYCKSNNNADHNFELKLVITFLTNNSWSFNTKRTRLSHIRKYAQILSVSDKDNSFNWQYNYERLKILKPSALGENTTVASKTALTNNQAYKVFDAIDGNSNKDTRDRSIMALMLLCGLRASEVISLKWDNIHYNNASIFIHLGKGNKSANIPMLGDTRYLLLEWQAKQSDSGIYDYVVCSISRGDTCGKPHKTTTRIISTLCKTISDRTGFIFRPHDTRRTMITTLLNNGANVHDVQKIARHSNGETTLRYAQQKDARELGSTLNDKMSYGDVMGAQKHTENGRYWECSLGHNFTAVNPTKCPICGITDISHQISMFDDYDIKK